MAVGNPDVMPHYYGIFSWTIRGHRLLLNGAGARPSDRQPPDSGCTEFIRIRGKRTTTTKTYVRGHHFSYMRANRRYNERETKWTEEDKWRTSLLTHDNADIFSFPFFIHIRFSLKTLPHEYSNTQLFLYTLLLLLLLLLCNETISSSFAEPSCVRSERRI